MKIKYGIALGITMTLVSAAGWIGCSSSNSSPMSDAGSTSTTTTSSSGVATTSSAATSSTTTSAATTPGDGGGDSGALTWGGSTGVFATVIQPHCLPCHTSMVPLADGGTRVGGGLARGLLDMSTVDAGYANLINVHAMGVSIGATDWQDAAVCDTLDAGPGSVRVVPGDAAASLLALKINGFTTPPPCGSPMPEPTPGPGEIDGGGQATAFSIVSDWINQGAKP